MADVLWVEEEGDDVGYLCGKMGGSMDQRTMGWIARQVCPLRVVMDDMRPITGLVWVFSSPVCFPGCRPNKGGVLGLMTMGAVVSPHRGKEARGECGV